MSVRASQPAADAFVQGTAADASSSNADHGASAVGAESNTAHKDLPLYTQKDLEEIISQVTRQRETFASCLKSAIEDFQSHGGSLPAITSSANVATPEAIVAAALHGITEAGGNVPPPRAASSEKPPPLEIYTSGLRSAAASTAGMSPKSQSAAPFRSNSTKAIPQHPPERHQQAVAEAQRDLALMNERIVRIDEQRELVDKEERAIFAVNDRSLGFTSRLPAAAAQNNNTTLWDSSPALPSTARNGRSSSPPPANPSGAAAGTWPSPGTAARNFGVVGTPRVHPQAAAAAASVQGSTMMYARVTPGAGVPAPDHSQAIAAAASSLWSFGGGKRAATAAVPPSAFSSGPAVGGGPAPRARPQEALAADDPITLAKLRYSALRHRLMSSSQQQAPSTSSGTPRTPR